MAVKYAVDLCGITHIAMTLLDVLCGLDHVQICTGYKHQGQRLDYFRADMDMLAEVEPIYETLPGWRGNITGCRRFDELPRKPSSTSSDSNNSSAPRSRWSASARSARRRSCINNTAQHGRAGQRANAQQD